MNSTTVTFAALVEADSRLASKVRLSPDGTGCWWWVGAVGSNGYGRYWRAGESLYAHRVVFSLAYGIDLAADQVLAHTCDETNCVRPDHLVLVAQAENLADARRKGRRGRARAGVLDPRGARGRALAVRAALSRGWDPSALADALENGAPAQPALFDSRL